MGKKEENEYLDNIINCGEFVCSEFAWLPLDKQKEQAKRMQDITKNKQNKK